MKNKVRIVCYGDSNTWGYSAETNARFADDERWTMRLQASLGEDYMVCEEGISGRTTVFEDPLNEGLCGMCHLATALGTHSPVDALVLMLGTNDCKQRFSASAQNIADGMERLVCKARSLDIWRGAKRVLIIAPILIGEGCYASAVAGEMGEGCVEKARLLPALLRETAKKTGCAFLDCNETAKANVVDFMHFSFDSNAPFAAAVQDALLNLLKQEEST